MLYTSTEVSLLLCSAALPTLIVYSDLQQVAACIESCVMMMRTCLQRLNAADWAR